MASTAALELLIRLTGDKEAADGMDELADKGGGMGDAIKNGAAIAGGAILGLGGILVGATKAAADDRAERDRLDQTLKNSIPNWDGNAEAIDNLIKKGQDLAFTDTDVRNSLGFLVGQTGDLTEAQNLQATAMDLARAKGIDLETATKAVGKVDQDSIGILKKLGITVTDHMTKEEALAAIRAQTAGQAETYANSAAGSLARMQDAVGEAFETVGGAILPLVEGPLQAIADWFSSSEVQEGITTIAQGVGEFLAGAFDTLVQVTSPVIDLFKLLWQNFEDGGLTLDTLNTMFSNLISWVEGIVGIDLSFVQNVWNAAFSAVKATLEAAWPILVNVFTFLRDNAVPILIGVGTAITTYVISSFIAWATTMLTTVLPAFLTTMAPIIAAVAPFIALGAAIGLLWLAFENNFLGIRDLVVPVVDAIVGAVSRWWTEIQPQAIAAWDAISSTAVNAWNWIQSTIVAGVLALVEGWNTNWGGMRTIIEDAWNTISAVVSIAWSIVSGIISAGLELLSGDWEGAWNTISTMLSDVWNTITNDLLPNALGMIWTLLTEFLPKLIGVLAEWTGAFFGWIWNDVIPQLPGWLGSLVNVIWTWVSDNAPVFLEKLGEWTSQFFDWIMNDVVPQIPTWLGNIAGALWTWITETAKSLGDKLFNEWIPAFWNWLTGPDGVLVNAAIMLNDIWIKFTDWIGTTASDILTAVVDIGANIVQGIWDGVSGAWQGFVDWLSTMVKDNLPGFIKDWLGIKSPSTVMADIFQYVPLGMMAGINLTWATFMTDMDTKMKALCDDDGAIAGPIKKMCDEDIPAALSGAVAAVKKFCDEDLPNATQGASLPGITNASANAKNQFLSDLDYMKSEYDKLQGYLQNGVSVGGVTTYNGNGTPNTPGPPINTGNNAANGGTGYNGGTAMATGGIVTGLTRAWLGDGNEPEMVLPLSKARSMGFGGGSTFNITINAGIGADARSISEAAIEAIEYALGDRVAIRRGGRA